MSNAVTNSLSPQGRLPQFDRNGVTTSVENSPRHLRTDVIDVIQLHGGMYIDAEVSHILNDGLLDALVQLREQGKVRFLGFTVEEPWTA